MGRPPKPKKPCGFGGCTEDARARGFCDTHYRRVLAAERGVGGIVPLDGGGFKLRVRLRTGATHPIYSSDKALATARARREKNAGRLLYFAVYTDPVDLFGTV